MRIELIESTTGSQREQMALLLVQSLEYSPTGWPDLESATDEVAKFHAADRIAYIAVEGEKVLGWVGGIKHSRHLWELHPLVVAPGHRGAGIGTKLVQTLESAAVDAGVSTIWLGTDDDFGGTNLFGENLYPDVLERLCSLRVTSRHPLTFYQKMGYTVVGVIPDAGGSGKHDILMAKRILPSSVI
jgi:aminoglycoside 6'-N-acetyltransferase I